VVAPAHQQIGNAMTDEHWGRLKEFLHGAMQIEPAQRGAYLNEVCAGDAALRVELESLLIANEQIPSAFMESPPLAGETGRDDEAMDAAALESGQVFAQRFRLIRMLGEGGMGQVWLAEQTSPVRRQVALKLIKAGMYDSTVVQRFRSERQSLAIMDHPAIAKVFDAGATPQGQPYFVMEYVAGLPITEYCDQHKLNIAQRLQLFIQACEGVQHAHQKAIIHRDIKPANILVVEVDGKPTARIIDFGLAKAIGHEPAEPNAYTRFGLFLGTPGYMSPEQVDPTLHDIDTRTDVYSLGVVLYVLLTGLQPFATKRPDQPIHELLRKLREEDPPSPSVKVSADRDTLTSTAQARGTEAPQLLSLLRGDLDWIAMKALERDRIRRYATPLELAADLRRYLNHDPVMARPASAGYRLRKYARRHRLALGVGAGLLLLLAAFSVLQALELRRTTLERDRASRITDFMTGMFKVSDPSEARGNSVTAREILDKASKEIGTSLSQDPEVQSQMMFVMATTYSNLGLYARAHELAKGALDARLRQFGPNDRSTLQSMTQLGSILYQEGSFADAEKQSREALATERQLLGPEDPLTLDTMDHVGIDQLEQGHYEAGEEMLQQVVATDTRVLGRENPQTLRAMFGLATALWLQGRNAESEVQYRELLGIERRVLGADHPETLRALGNLAMIVHTQGRWTEAEPLYREAVSTELRIVGPDNPQITNTMANLAALLAAEGRLDEAEKIYRDVLAIRLRLLGPENPSTLLSREDVAEQLLQQGRGAEAEAMQRDTLAIQLRVLGAEHPNALLSQSHLAGILIAEQKYADAEKVARASLDVSNRVLGPQHPVTLNTLRKLGRALAFTGRYNEGSQPFLDLIEAQKTSGGKGNRWSPWYGLACVAMAAGRPDDALRDLREAIDRGYKNSERLVSDSDLKNLRDNPQFQQLVAALRRPPDSPQKQ
jgi:eukaryotic-like serine/threonine-protein kinase